MIHALPNRNRCEFQTFYIRARSGTDLAQWDLGIRELHWCPIHKWIIYKLFLITHKCLQGIVPVLIITHKCLHGIAPVLIITNKCLHGIAPAYLSDLLSLKHSRGLCSDHQMLLTIPRSNLVSYGDRTFSHLAPRPPMNCFLHIN